MDLRKLTIFRAVAQQGGFSGAAEALHIAQPAVSIAVQKLEDELGTLLFNRRGRRAKLTDEGLEVLEHTERILAEVEALKDTVQLNTQLLRGVLSISCPAMLATYYLPNLLGEFLGIYPGISAAVSQVGTQQAKEQLLNHDVDLAVITLESDQNYDAFEVIPLVKEELVLCTSETTRWDNREFIHIRELHREPVVLYEKSYHVRHSVDALCQQFDVTPDIRVQTNFLPLLIRSVKQGLGATIGLPRMAEQEGLHATPLRPKVELNLALAKLQNHSIAKPNQAFFEWIANTQANGLRN